MVQPLWGCLKKLKTELSYDSAIPLLSIYPKELKSRSESDINTIFTALFTIAKMWKQPKRPLTDEWIRKKWYLHT